ncbi:MAG: RagB/SusD family nutrient uptake outer membrane protein [Prevotella sp.]|nr:RagB/SusD family nutrient uptake outer membrane protein [Prevotella sp.]
MKINKIFYLAAASVLAVSCADLDTEPQGSTVTADQKAEVAANDPSKVSASVTGITTMFSIYEKSFSSHHDYGHASMMLFNDSRGIDLIGFDTGYNWYSAGLTLGDRTLNAYGSYYAWVNAYNQIFAANAVVGQISAETENSTLKFYLAQALCIRAFDYFNLIQQFQFTYKGNEDAPGVPVILDTNADEAGANGIARNTVGEVYEQILADLNLAVDLLEASTEVRADKRYVDLGVALGLRARVNLVMQNWAEAAADAQAAIAATDAEPISIEEASKPGFVSMTEKDWMWGIYIAETDRVVTSAIVNWPSHMGSFNYGYASVGAWRMINPSLYNMMNVTDARKGWFLDASSKSVNLTAQQQAYVTQNKMPAYTQVKFAPYNGELGTSTNANDVPLMRVEEMYLIVAEAQAMAGNPAGGKTALENFVKTYRDPQYTCEAASAAAVQDAVWVQRRIELWGEGLSYFDLLRLRKGIDRASTLFSTVDPDKKLQNYNYRIVDTVEGERAAIETVKSGNGSTTGTDINYLIYQIPNEEIQANKLINEGDNNLGAPQLVPVPVN